MGIAVRHPMLAGMKSIVLIAALFAAPAAASSLSPGMQSEKERCERIMAALDAGNRESVVAVYGDFTADIVETCEWLLDDFIPKIEGEAA